jgi:hypothetical protein
MQNQELKDLQCKYKYDIQVMRIKMLVLEDKHEQEMEIIKKQHEEEIKQLCEKMQKLEEKKQIITC